MIVQELVAKLGLEVDEQVFSRVEQVMKGLAGGLLGIGAAVGAAVVGIGAIVRNTALAGDHIQTMSERIGISTDAFQELSHAAEMTDTNSDALMVGLKHLSSTMYEASTGSESAREAVAALGVSIYDSSGKLKKPDQMLQDLADRFMTLDNATQRNALAVKVFGRSGLELVPMLRKGSAGIDELRKRAHELGIVLDEAAIKAGSDYDDAAKELTAAVRGLGYAFAPLIPYLTELVKWLTKFVEKARPIIQRKLENALKTMGATAKWLKHNFYLLQLGLGTLVTFMIFKMLTTLAALTAAEVSWGLAALIAGARAFAAGVLAAAGGALALLPWVLLAAAIFLVGEDLYQFFTGGESAMGRYGERWTKFLDEVYKPRDDDSWFTDMLKGWGRFFADIPTGIDNLAKDWKKIFGDVWNWIKDTATEAVNWVIGKFTNAGQAIKSLLPSFLTDNKVSGGAGEAIKPLTIMPFEGGAASPTAAARIAAATSSNPAPNMSSTMHATVQVTVPPGSDGKTIGNAAAEQLDDWWKVKAAEAHAAVNQ